MSPNTLRSWERRFGYPHPQRSRGGHRRYAYAEVLALRDALQRGLGISSAVSMARGRMDEPDAGTLIGALSGFDPERADRVLEGALDLGSMERAVERVLLPALDDIAARHGTTSALWAFSCPWAQEWLRRARRVAAPPGRPPAVLVGDALTHELDPEAVRVRALELVCARAGARVLTLSVRVTSGLSDVLAAQPPDVVVIAGVGLRDDTAARWAYAVRGLAGPVPIALYRPRILRQRTGAPVLPDLPTAAQRELVALAADQPALSAVASSTSSRTPTPEPPFAA